MDRRDAATANGSRHRLRCRALTVPALLAGMLASATIGPAGAELAAVSPTPIAVEGNRRVDAETVRAYFRPASAGRYDAAALDAALKALLATGLFDDVRIERSGPGLIVHVAEAKVIGRVAFEGNKKINDGDLAAAVQSKPGGSLQRATVQGDVGRIVEAYRHVGRDDVSVAPQTIDRGNERVDLVFTVVEGRKTTVQHIHFVGNRAFGSRQLAAVISTSATNVLSFLTRSDIYDPDRITDDRERLRAYYRDHGYADVSVAEPRAEFDPARGGFVLTFTIDEGEVYRFGNVKLECNVAGLEPERLRSRLLARAGATFDGSALDRTAEALAVKTAKLGYPFARAVPRTSRDPAAHRIDVTFVVDETSRRYVDRIEIHGNSRTRDYVIRREFDIAEGDALNQTLVDRAERRLKNLGYFKTVKISTRPGSTTDRVVLDVEAVDQPTGDFFVSGGHSSTDGWLGEVTLGDRNFQGTGTAVEGKLSYGQFARGVDVSVSQPYFLGSRATGGAELFARQTFASSYQSYGSDTYGGSLTLGTPLTQQTGMQWRYSIYNQAVTLSPSGGTTVSLPIEQAAAAGPAWVSAAGTTTTYSTLDNTRSPTSGVNSQLRQDLAGLGGDVRFLRTAEDARYYHPLGNDVVAMVRAQGGYVTGWGGQQTPLLNSFFGGPGMVRGFAPNGFGPRDLTPGSTMDNLGGSMYWATTAELQSGIPGIPDEYGLKASAFVDAGSVFRYAAPTTFGSQSVNVANANVLRSSVGVGLSWASPFGALAVNYAVPVTKAAYDVVQPFSFTASPF